MDSEIIKFIGREAELLNLEESLDSIKEGRPLTEPIWFIYGVPLVGKSSLLSKVQNLARSRGIPTALIDFDREKYNNGRVDSRYDDSVGQVILAQELMGQLVSWIDDSPSPNIQSSDDPLVASNKLLREVERIHNVYKKPVVFLFDTLEDVEEDTFAWMLREIIQPVKDSRALILMAAKTHYRELGLEIDWSILRKMHIHKLEPFDEQHSLEQIRLLSTEKNVPWREKSTIEFTGGIPGLNKEVLSAKRLFVTLAVLLGQDLIS